MVIENLKSTFEISFAYLSLRFFLHVFVSCINSLWNAFYANTIACKSRRECVCAQGIVCLHTCMSVYIYPFVDALSQCTQMKMGYVLVVQQKESNITLA